MSNGGQSYMLSTQSPSEFQPLQQQQQQQQQQPRHSQFVRPTSAINNSNLINQNIHNHHNNQHHHNHQHHLNHHNIHQPSPSQQHHQPPLASSISSPICQPSSGGLSVISLGANQIQSSHSFMSPSQASHLAKSSNFNAEPNNNRASFMSRGDRKPEELDAVANELLSEFAIKKIDLNSGGPVSSSSNSNNNSNSVLAPVSLSPLSSSSSSPHSSRSSTSSASSSDSEKENNESPIRLTELNEELGETSPRASAIETSHLSPANSNSNESTPTSNKSGTLIIRRDNPDQTKTNEGLNVNLPDILPQQVTRIQQNQVTKSNEPHSFVSYNPNTKAVITNTSSEQGHSPSSSIGVGGGVGAIVQPINEPQFRRGTQVSFQNGFFFLLDHDLKFGY